jgi:hypothetical protein
MKSFELPISSKTEKLSRSFTPINKKSLYYFLFLITGIGGFFFPNLFILFGILLVGGSAFYCQNLYKEISSLDFSSDKYYITLEEIIEDLEG